MNFYHKPCCTVSQWVDYLGSQNDLSVSRHKEGAEGVFTGHRANHLQSRSVTLWGGAGHPVRPPLSNTSKTSLRQAGTETASPVPNFDGVPRGREDGQVVRAEGQRAHIGAVASEREASRLIGRGGLVWSLQAVGLDGVVLQQQCHLQLTTCTGQALRPSERRWRRGVHEVRK